MPVKKKPRKPMSAEARAAASERMRKFNESRRVQAKEDPALDEKPLQIYETDFTVEDLDFRAEDFEDPDVHQCQWLSGQYRSHDSRDLRLTDVYCPVGKHWEPVDA